MAEHDLIKTEVSHDLADTTRQWIIFQLCSEQGRAFELSLHRKEALCGEDLTVDELGLRYELQDIRGISSNIISSALDNTHSGQIKTETESLQSAFFQK